MKKLITLLFISIISLVGYGQIVEVPTTLLRIDGVEKGIWLDPSVKELPIAWQYVFVINDTLNWTTVPIDSLQYQNTKMQAEIDALKLQIEALKLQMINKMEYGDTSMIIPYHWNDGVIIESKPIYKIK